MNSTKTRSWPVGQLFAAAIAVCSIVSSANAAFIPLSPSSVIGQSGSYGPTVDAKNIFDNQSATSISEPDQNGIWNGKDGDKTEYIVIDLGLPTSIDNIRLYNSHNSIYNDRWVGDFIVSGANSITSIISGETGANGFDLSGSITQLVSGTLSFQSWANDPIEPQDFTPSSAATFRYLRLETLAANAGPSVALNEMMVFGTAVPEPSTYALLAVGGTALLLVRRRWMNHSA